MVSSISPFSPSAPSFVDNSSIASFRNLEKLSLKELREKFLSANGEMRKHILIACIKKYSYNANDFEDKSLLLGLLHTLIRNTFYDCGVNTSSLPLCNQATLEDCSTDNQWIKEIDIACLDSNLKDASSHSLNDLVLLFKNLFLYIVTHEEDTQYWEHYCKVCVVIINRVLSHHREHVDRTLLKQMIQQVMDCASLGNERLQSPSEDFQNILEELLTVVTPEGCQKYLGMNVEISIREILLTNCIASDPDKAQEHCNRLVLLLEKKQKINRYDEELAKVISDYSSDSEIRVRATRLFCANGSLELEKNTRLFCEEMKKILIPLRKKGQEGYDRSRFSEIVEPMTELFLVQKDPLNRQYVLQDMSQSHISPLIAKVWDFVFPKEKLPKFWDCQLLLGLVNWRLRPAIDEEGSGVYLLRDVAENAPTSTHRRAKNRANIFLKNYSHANFERAKELLSNGNTPKEAHAAKSYALAACFGFDDYHEDDLKAIKKIFEANVTAATISDPKTEQEKIRLAQAHLTLTRVFLNGSFGISENMEKATEHYGKSQKYSPPKISEGHSSRESLAFDHATIAQDREDGPHSKRNSSYRVYHDCLGLGWAFDSDNENITVIKFDAFDTSMTMNKKFLEIITGKTHHQGDLINPEKPIETEQKSESRRDFFKKGDRVYSKESDDNGEVMEDSEGGFVTVKFDKNSMPITVLKKTLMLLSWDIS